MDKFYTKKEVARSCMDILQKYVTLDEKYILIEPSAGTGIFYDIFPTNNKIGYDLDPKHPDIITKDFLSIPIKSDQEIIYIGNPPFGRCSSLALKFINRCAKDGKYIAMILPRTFSKRFFQNRIDDKLHLIHESDIPPKSFIKDGQEKDVPCIFQIWIKKETSRAMTISNNIYFSVVGIEEAEYAIRRAGSRAGGVLEGLNHSPSSTMFIKDKIKGVKNIIQEIYPTLKEEASKTVGVRSITPNEISFYIEKYQREKYNEY